MPWYELAHSGHPYYTPGPSRPPGARRIAGPHEARAHVPAEPADVDTIESPTIVQVLGGTVDQVVEQLDGADLDTIEQLLEAEHAGAARKGLLDRLARMRDQLQSTSDDEG